MSQVDVLPELKQIIGAMLFASKEPVTVSQIRTVLKRVGEQREGAFADFAAAGSKDIKAALQLLADDLRNRHAGFQVVEVAGGFRLENDANCGPWIRDMLNKGKGNRLSRPALETLAIIAYRQPCTRSEIEAVRGVAVDQIVRNLLELGLVKVAGRSELPGRPWLFGTTQKFLEHFGIKHIRDLPDASELQRREEKKQAEEDAQAELPIDEDAPPSSGPAESEGTEEESAGLEMPEEEVKGEPS